METRGMSRVKEGVDGSDWQEQVRRRTAGRMTALSGYGEGLTAFYRSGPDTMVEKEGKSILYMV
jgi:hypothetical protein